MHVLYIVGNRPQFIKLALLHKKVKGFSGIRESVIHTGQHFSVEMSDVFFEELTIEIPIKNLGIHSLSHITMIGRTMEALELEMKRIEPDLVVVFGDTNATLAGALTAKKLGIPIFHIEAGIRTFDESMPEESNRYLTDRLADVNFCCTYLGVEHLKKEGYNNHQIKSKIVNSGDLMLDAFQYFDNSILSQQNLSEANKYSVAPFVLFTLHRRQNLENVKVLAQIIEAVNDIHQQIPVVCPLHPLTKQLLQQHNLICQFNVLPPQGYVAMQTLVRGCSYIITDSGGLQREAFFAKKPALILMEQPFWPEVIKHGNAINCKSRKESIKAEFDRLKMFQNPFDSTVFGNGDAAGLIVNTMVSFYHEKMERSGN